MSASTSSTESPTPTQSSAPSPTESGVNIPTSTVVAIGGGFVCFALCVLGSLLLVRLVRLFIRSRRSGVPFREAWETQGGFFGWLHGVGPRSRNREDGGGGYLAWMPASGIGGGGWYAQEMARVRMWNEMARAARGDKDFELWDGQVPALWEVDVGKAPWRGGGEQRASGEVAAELAEYQPISVGPTNVPEKNARDPLKSPRVNVRVSLLIALPSPDIDRNRLSLDSAEDEDPDIPDMVMGSMVFTPFVTMPRRRTRTEGKKGEVKHIEDRSTGQDTEMRQAEWVRRGDKWLMEGLDDVDHDAAGKAG